MTAVICAGSTLYLQQEADGAFAGFKKQLLETDTKHLTFQSVPYSITHAQLITHLLQSRVPVCTHTALDLLMGLSKDTCVTSL